MFKKVFLGDKPIAKIYLGDKLIKYNIVTSIPPKFLNTVPNFTTDVNKAIEMYYVASDDLGIVLHEFYDGSTWRRINPTSIENTHYFTLTFDTVGVKQCQIRISDADGNVVTSNQFTLKVTHPLVADIIYASNVNNQLYALDSVEISQVSTKQETGTIGALLKMDKNIYVANNRSTTIKRYNEKLQHIEASNSTYDPIISMLGEYNATDATNYIYAVYSTMIIRHTHNASLTDRKIINNFDSDFKHAVYVNKHIYTLRQDNHIVIYDDELTVVKDITDTTASDFLIVDAEHIYKCPREYGTFKKFNISTGQEIKQSTNNMEYMDGVNIGDQLLMVDKSMTSLYVLDKNDFSVLRSKYIDSKIGSIDVDDDAQKIYIGDQLGGICILDYSTWTISKSVTGVCVTDIKHITI